MNATHLYNRLCSPETLWNAWKAVKSKNTAGGIDAVSVKSFEKNADSEIKKISIELIEGNYTPHPYKSTTIPKSNSQNRELGLLTVRDKIVQSAANYILYPIIDKQLTSSCYAYRQGKGAVKAARKVKHLIVHEKYSYILSCDIKTYFDCIDHKVLFDLLVPIIPDSKMLDFIALSIKMGRIKNGNRWADRVNGVPQGGILSPLLANLYLTPLDKAIEKKQFGYVRYADDFVILSKSKDQLENLASQMKTIVETQLKLKLKSEPQISSIEQSFCFLGLDFGINFVSINADKRERMKQKLTIGFEKPAHQKMKIIKKQLDGYRNFYGKLLPETELLFIDETLISLINDDAKSTAIKTITDLRSYLNEITFITDTFQKKKEELIKTIVKEITAPNLPTKNHTKLIAKRKKEYQKLEAQGMELILNSFGTSVGASMGKVTVRKKGENVQSIPMVNLNHITILSNGISISTDLIYHCTQNNIPVSFFSRDGKHYATLYSPVGADSSLWHHQLLAETSEKGLAVAASLVNAKIRNQANLLKYFNKYHKETDKGFAVLYEKKIEKLSQLAKQATEVIGFENDSYRQHLMGIEAQAAMIYWELVAELINDDSDFAGREKKGAKDLVNSLLNYGYAILYSRVWKAIIGARLNPYISYLHVASNNKPTLSFDLIEVFRQQAVDRVVITMLQKKERLVTNNGILDQGWSKDF